MPSEQTEKSRYHSRYSEKYVHSAQYICELICEHKAQSMKKELPIRFWKLKEWAAYFRSQINTAHKLLKQYDEKAIIRALNSPKSRKTYSLRSPFLLPIIEEEHKRMITERAAVPANIIEADVNAKPRERIDPLAKLKELDDL